MRRSILRGQTPDLFLLRYERPAFVVKALTLIPHFALSVSVLEKRKPLSPEAERHDWVGCNFLLDRIPVDVRIPVISDGRIAPPSDVRAAYKKMKSLEELTDEKRGWTLDVLNVVRSLRKNEFTLSEVYDHADDLAALHPGNHHVNEKIRQQLQELRKLNFLEFLSPGCYRVRPA
jgi:type II restriction enzyme